VIVIEFLQPEQPHNESVKSGPERLLLHTAYCILLITQSMTYYLGGGVLGGGGNSVAKQQRNKSAKRGYNLPGRV
jgi:hypothetical protein